MTDTPKFRWHYYSAGTDWTWSEWHQGEPPCPACCCPKAADAADEHKEPSEYYDEDGILANGHTRFDPNDSVCGHVEREWRYDV